MTLGGCRWGDKCWAVAAGLLMTALPVAAQYQSENVDLLSRVSLSEFGATFAEDSWGYVSPSGREYAIIGLSNGTGFVEITDPSNPVIIAVMLQPNRGRDMKVYQNYVYSSSVSVPTYVYDVANIDQGVITLVRSISAEAHNLAVDEVSGFLYLAVGGPMHAYDLSDPSNPLFVGTWPGQTHDARVVTYSDGPYAGRQIAFVFAGWDGWIDIVDVTDKSNMFHVGRSGYPDPYYTHQGWLTADRHYLYVNDELDEANGQPTTRTIIIDVSDLSAPFYAGSFTSGWPTTDHNLYVRDGFIFEANYASGMHVFDAADPLNPVHVGYFDTYPPSNTMRREGAWNVYPFFPSGTVIVSDRSGGLFVLDVSAALGGRPGDLNCDGTFNGGDIDPFFLALGDPAAYALAFPNCDPLLGDMNGDGRLDGGDIDPFFECLGGGACP